MWPVDLSVRLPVFGLVSRYLTNCLIGHKSLQKRISAFHLPAYGVLAPVSRRWPPLSDKSLCFTHPSAAEMYQSTEVSQSISAQLACVKHAASVRPEPGSNSPLNPLSLTYCIFPARSRLASLPRPLLLSRCSVARSPTAPSLSGAPFPRATWGILTRVSFSVYDFI